MGQVKVEMRRRSVRTESLTRKVIHFGTDNDLWLGNVGYYTHLTVSVDGERLSRYIVPIMLSYYALEWDGRFLALKISAVLEMELLTVPADESDK